MKICLHLRLHIKITWRRFYIISPYSFWDMRTLDLWNVCLQTFRNNRICQKLAYFLRNLQTLPINNSRILRITNAKFAEYCFYMSTNIYRNIQISISVPLIPFKNVLLQQSAYYLKVASSTFLLLCFLSAKHLWN